MQQDHQKTKPLRLYVTQGNTMDTTATV